ncbi:MAG: M16 family metallopeptidase [Thermomicrobiales bacterium]
MYQKTTLLNGVRVVTSSMEHVRSATLHVNYRVGSRDESDDQAGIAHFIEHMLFKGTTRRPQSSAITEEIEGIGGNIDAGTSRETTSYSVRVPYDALETGFDVLADMLRGSLFRQDDVEKEREVITEEIRGINDIPDEVVGELIDRLVWDDAAVGRPIAGSEETVARLTRDELTAFLATRYAPERLVISAAGKIAHDDVVALASAAFGDLAPAATPPDAPFLPPTQTKPRVALVGREIEQANLSLAVQAISYSDPRKYAQYLLHIILGGTMSSRLFLRIREDLGLAYNVGSYFPTLVDVGWGTIYAGVDPDRAEQTVTAILDELVRLRTEPVTPTEFERARRYVTGSLLMGLEGSAPVASWIGMRELLLGDILTPEDVVAHYNAVTIEDVQALACDLFLPERLNLAIVGPYEDDSRFRALIGA